MPVCLKHPDRESTARCCSCGKPICRECVVRRGRSVFCSEQCIEEFMRTTGRTNGFIARERAFQRKKLLVRLLTTFGIAIAALAFAWYYLHR
ncbi:MAG: hypothetical protein GXP31_17630 [Kiritimatiellaeota bacterium]|nr:hypothetical protein [Kiritimatiellota bacterium]